MLLGFHHKYHIYTPGIELWQLCFSLSYGTAIFFFFVFLLGCNCNHQMWRWIQTKKYEHSILGICCPRSDSSQWNDVWNMRKLLTTVFNACFIWRDLQFPAIYCGPVVSTHVCIICVWFPALGAAAQSKNCHAFLISNEYCIVGYDQISLSLPIYLSQSSYNLISLYNCILHRCKSE